MLVLSIATILEEATVESRGYTGKIRSLDALFSEESLARLKNFAKAYCFLAFHSRGDAAVADYVKGGTLPDDSGPNLLVLFPFDEPAPIAVPVDRVSFAERDSFIDVEKGTHPAYEIVRMLFDGKPVPPLPGLVLFADLARDSEALYVSLRHLKTEHEVRVFLRQVFNRIDSVAVKVERPREYFDDLAKALSDDGITVEGTSRKPMREWLKRALQFMRNHYGDIVSTIGLLK